MADECDHCEKAKRTYKWYSLGSRKVGGVTSLVCSYCDSVKEWPPSSPVRQED